MKKLLMMISISAMALSLTACGGNDCEDAADTIVDKYEECGVDLPEGVDPDEEMECTDDEAKTASCMEACFEDVDCDILDGTSTDVDAATAFGACVSDCL